MAVSRMNIRLYQTKGRPTMLSSIVATLLAMADRVAWIHGESATSLAV